MTQSDHSAKNFRIKVKVTKSLTLVSTETINYKRCTCINNKWTFFSALFSVHIETGTKGLVELEIKNGVLFKMWKICEM